MKLKTTLWQHQEEGARIASERNILLHVPMGGGKTLMALSAIARMNAHAILIICPAAVRGVWRREIERHVEGFTQICVPTDGSVSERCSHINSFMYGTSGAAARFVIINYESLAQASMRECLMNWTWDCMVVDESHRTKAPDGVISKAIREKLFARRKILLSGTPMPHSPFDIWAQSQIVDPGSIADSFTKFKSRYAVMDGFYPTQVRAWVNQEELKEKTDAIRYYVNLDGVLDVPDATDQTLEVKLGDHARKIYDQLEKEFFAEVDSGAVAATNALTKLLRLQQITSGFARCEDGVDRWIDRAKIGALNDILYDAPKPVVVFTRFTNDLDQVRAVAESLKLKYGEVSGRRNDLTEHATMPEDVEVMGVNMQSGGVGVDLTRACVGVFYSMGFNLAEYLQARARLARPGQKRLINFWHLVATDTVDTYVRRALADRAEVIEAVLARNDYKPVPGLETKAKAAPRGPLTRGYSLPQEVVNPWVFGPAEGVAAQTFSIPLEAARSMTDRYLQALFDEDAEDEVGF